MKLKTILCWARINLLWRASWHGTKHISSFACIRGDWTNKYALHHGTRELVIMSIVSCSFIHSYLYRPRDDSVCCLDKILFSKKKLNNFPIYIFCSSYSCYSCIHWMHHWIFVYKWIEQVRLYFTNWQQFFCSYYKLSMMMMNHFTYSLEKNNSNWLFN